MRERRHSRDPQPVKRFPSERQTLQTRKQKRGTEDNAYRRQRLVAALTPRRMPLSAAARRCERRSDEENARSELPGNRLGDEHTRV